MLNKTLEQLDGQDWGEPNYPSHLVAECFRLRHVPLKDFTDDDLRRLIGQHMSLDWLVPLALMRLYDEPFAGDSYDGDLLNAVLSLPDDFWNGHPDLRDSRSVIVIRAMDLFLMDSDLSEYLDDSVVRLLEKNQGISQSKTS